MRKAVDFYGESTTYKCPWLTADPAADTAVPFSGSTAIKHSINLLGYNMADQERRDPGTEGGPRYTLGYLSPYFFCHGDGRFSPKWYAADMVDGDGCGECVGLDAHSRGFWAHTVRLDAYSSSFGWGPSQCDAWPFETYFGSSRRQAGKVRRSSSSRRMQIVGRWEMRHDQFDHGIFRCFSF